MRIKFICNKKLKNNKKKLIRFTQKCKKTCSKIIKKIGYMILEKFIMSKL